MADTEFDLRGLPQQSGASQAETSIIYDAIVIGCGGVGSATLYHLASRGATVLGLDAFPPGHDRGSSHGQTRIIRQAYFEHPDYVPLLKRAYELWAELEAGRPEPLYHETGLLQVGPPDGRVLPGVLASAREHDVAVEALTAEEVEDRFPGFAVPDSLSAVLEQGAGYLLVEDCVMAHIEQARRHGAELRTGNRVTRWQASGDTVVVETETDRFEARHLIVTAGAWAAQLLADLNLELQILRKHLHWYANAEPGYRSARGAPIFLYEVPAGIFYGFPQIDDLGVKVAEHSGGEAVTNPSSLDRSPDHQDRLRVEQFLNSYLPGVSSISTRHEACMYTMSPDEHFIVDRHPYRDNVLFAAGLSGHGFKFTSVLGELLADLALDGETGLLYDFLRLGRLQQPA